MAAAARQGDRTQHGGVIVVGCSSVLVGGKPAARLGDEHQCPASSGLVPHRGGPVLQGSGTVFIGGKPAARTGDPLACNGPLDAIVEGEPSVQIG